MLRVAISAIAFLPFVFIHFKKLEWSRWFYYLLVALTGSGIPAILYATAQTKLSSGTVGILNSMTPVATLIVSAMIFKIASSFRQLIGTVMSLSGAVLLILMSDNGSGGGIDVSQMFYASLILAGCIMYALNVNMVKMYFQHVPPVQLSSFAFVLLGLPFVFIIPFTDVPRKIMDHPHALYSVGALVILAIVSTVLALMLFYKLLQETNAVFASTVAYLIPVIALLWGLIDGENITWVHLLSLLIVIAGVYLIKDKKLESR